jgi:hypothetical protein
VGGGGTTYILPPNIGDNNVFFSNGVMGFILKKYSDS